jgi:Concanavalin A-like lectin/glucanases superfamily
MAHYLRMAIWMTAIASTTSADQTLIGLRIDGPNQVIEGRIANYHVVGQLSNGTEFDTTLCAKLDLHPGANASLDNTGELHAGVVKNDQVETLRASFDFHGTVQTAVMDVTILNIPVQGFALRFDGINDFVRVPRSPSLEPTEITVELWAKLDGPQTRNTRLLRKLDHFGIGGYILAADQDSDRRMQFRVPPGLVPADPTLHTAYVNQWHHYAGVYSLNDVKLLVDGAIVASVSQNIGGMTHNPLVDLYIGSGKPSPDPSEYFGGWIDEVRVWNVPRSAQAILVNLHRTLAGTDSGLIGYWRFDEGLGQAALDFSPFHNDGTLGSNIDPAGDSSDPQWVLSDAPIFSGPASPDVAR